jgi:hypothetical protein
MTTEQTPQQQLDAMSAALRPAEPPATPTTPQEAQARLNHLAKNDRAWADRLLKGDVATKAEFTKLSEQAAAGEGPLNPDMEIVDCVTNPGALPKAHVEGFYDMFRDFDLPPEAEAHMRALDSGESTDRPTQGDKEAYQRALDKASEERRVPP